MHDSLRPKVQSCIKYARDEGKLNVILISGDHKLTVEKIAERAGIIDETTKDNNNVCMTS